MVESHNFQILPGSTTIASHFNGMSKGKDRSGVAIVSLALLVLVVMLALVILLALVDQDRYAEKRMIERVLHPWCGRRA
jgi:threonine/homoserine/homoserine lactone efflux protein